MKLPEDKELNIMWSVATSSAIESGMKPHLIFARLLYSTLSKEKPRVTPANNYGNFGKSTNL